MSEKSLCRFTGAYQASNAVSVTTARDCRGGALGGLVGPGLYQINVVVPGAAAGDQPVMATVVGVSSNTGPVLTVAG